MCVRLFPYYANLVNIAIVGFAEAGDDMPEFCRIQYDHYYDQHGSQYVLVVVYDEGNAIDEVWSNSGSIDDEDDIQQFGDQQLAKLLHKMRGEGWEVVAKDEIKALDEMPVSQTTIYQMKRERA